MWMGWKLPLQRLQLPLLLPQQLPQYVLLLYCLQPVPKPLQDMEAQDCSSALHVSTSRLAESSNHFPHCVISGLIEDLVVKNADSPGDDAGCACACSIQQGLEQWGHCRHRRRGRCWRSPRCRYVLQHRACAHTHCQTDSCLALIQCMMVASVTQVTRLSQIHDQVSICMM